jgi:hypothetical protein
MKGIAHFSVGLAIASCFPDAVAAAARGNGLYFLVGGIAGLLPDTLDFRLARFLARHDVYLTPDPLNPDAGTIAGGIADAMRAAHLQHRAVSLKLAPIRLGPQSWQRYTIAFDVRERTVRVALGPVVTTGGDVLRRPRYGERGMAAAQIPQGVRMAYMAETTVDAFDGPSFRFVPSEHGLSVQFIAWHRRWTHSVLSAGLLGGVLALFAGPLAGLIAALAAAAHALLDQAGYLGGSLLHPLVRRRLPGCRVTTSSDAWNNFTCVWFCSLLAFHNLARQAPFSGGLTFAQVLVVGIGLPMALRAALTSIAASRAR